MQYTGLKSTPMDIRRTPGGEGAYAGPGRQAGSGQHQPGSDDPEAGSSRPPQVRSPTFQDREPACNSWWTCQEAGRKQ
jgi:hypothetical protein